jgi:hypothetical protein
MPAVSNTEPLKYRLFEHFVAKFGIAYATAQKQFAQNIGTSYRTIQRDTVIRISEPNTIPAKRLIQYAEFLKQPIEKLRNHKL